MRLERADHGFCGVDGQWRAALALGRIDQQGQAGYMVQMRVRDEHMIDPEQLVQTEAGEAGSGI